ncbi:cell cycle control protein 50A [Protopterus annectens]|uniref:cell cycle control protein 50A n=1 Tax=Protopterus annectens TaxID=7888 RepID=UPI001CFBD9F4|nr:cell cycle control protein 50A [Protopterus annectens]
MMASSYSAKEEDGHHSVTAGPAVKSKKPDNTAFKQQRLPAWQPILTAGTVLPAFFVIGIIFIPIGIGLLVTSNNIKEFEIDYTGIDINSPCYNCTQYALWNSTTPCKCSVPFTLEQPFEVLILLYYPLGNFYGGHRHYVNSDCDNKTTGFKNALRSPSKECEPYRTSNNKPIAPCGAIANSMFNGKLCSTVFLLHVFKFEVNCSSMSYCSSVISLSTENVITQNFFLFVSDTTKPLNWQKNVYELDTDPDNNGFINEDFIVWMRTAALPTFRKLYGIIERKNSMSPTLQRGNYSLEVMYHYTVHSFDGRKRMILSTISWMGGKNPFLGIAYITVGSICFFLGVVLLIIHHKYGNRNSSAEIPN